MERVTVSTLLLTFHKILKKNGLSLIELLIAIFIMVLVVGAAFSVYVLVVKGYKGESKVSETVMSLQWAEEIIRRDVEHAGCGLFTKLTSNITYSEADYTANGISASSFNDAPSGVPRALILSDEAYTWSSNFTSDWLVIKSTRVADNEATRVWGVYDAEREAYTPIGEGKEERVWGVLLQIEGEGLKLFVSGEDWCWRVKVSGGSISDLPSGLPSALFLFFGLRPESDRPARPFHRVDYFVSVPNGGLPEKCAPATGILYRVLLRNDGKADYQPLVDCVKDFQVAVKFGNSWVRSLIVPPEQLRGKVSEVRAFILAQEGQKFEQKLTDIDKISIGDEDVGILKEVGLSEEDKYYRWRVLKIVARPVLLKGEK